VEKMKFPVGSGSGNWSNQESKFDLRIVPLGLPNCFRRFSFGEKTTCVGTKQITCLPNCFGWFSFGEKTTYKLHGDTFLEPDPTPNGEGQLHQAGLF